MTDSVILKTRYSHYEEKVAYDAWQQHRLHAVESIAKAKVRYLLSPFVETATDVPLLAEPSIDQLSADFTEGPQ